LTLSGLCKLSPFSLSGNRPQIAPLGSFEVASGALFYVSIPRNLDKSKKEPPKDDKTPKKQGRPRKKPLPPEKTNKESNSKE